MPSALMIATALIFKVTFDLIGHVTSVTTWHGTKRTISAMIMHSGWSMSLDNDSMFVHVTRDFSLVLRHVVSEACETTAARPIKNMLVYFMKHAPLAAQYHVRFCHSHLQLFKQPPKLHSGCQYNHLFTTIYLA